jgi:hypothetical protein
VTVAASAGVRLKTIAIDGEWRLDGWRVVDERVLRGPDGVLHWFVQPPTRRRWSETGTLMEASPCSWTASHDDQGVVVTTAGRCEADVLSMPPAVGRAFLDDRPEPLLVLGSFAPLAGPRDLERFLVGGTVLDTTDFDGRRCPSEQTALSLYRIARVRGGAFWDATADLVAAVVAGRIEASSGVPVHDLWRHGETHVRFLADAVLLLAAQAEREHDPRWLSACELAADGLETFTVSLAGQRWFVHDSLELRGGNDLVLNTHVQSLLAMRACGRDVQPGVAALESVLRLRPRRRTTATLALAVTLTEAARSAPGRAIARRAERLAARVAGRAARERARQPHLRLPGGHLARDVRSGAAPAHYLTVNLNDLAGLVRNVDCPKGRAALDAGVRFARRTGFFRSQLRAGDPLTTLVPVLLRNAGAPRAAARWAERALAAGWPATVGWPGYEDRLWSRLAAGTP